MSDYDIDFLKGLADLGHIVLLPTETVWGLAASAYDRIAIRNIYKLKGRDFNKPLVVCIKDLEHAQTLGVFSERAREVAVAHWPGPLTIIVPVKKNTKLRPEAISHLDELETVAFRCPDVFWREDLSETPLVLTSANTSGQPPATTEATARAYFENLAAPSCPDFRCSHRPSTIISVIDNNIKILRQGDIYV